MVGRGLDLLALGETEAFHSGVAVERLKRLLIMLVAAAAGAAVSVSGVIGFVGLIVPHLLRLAVGPGHGPGNRFWRTLHEVGLTPTELRPDEYARLLNHGIGLTDLARAPSAPTPT